MGKYRGSSSSRCFRSILVDRKLSLCDLVRDIRDGAFSLCSNPCIRDGQRLLLFALVRGVVLKTQHDLLRCYVAFCTTSCYIQCFEGIDRFCSRCRGTGRTGCPHVVGQVCQLVCPFCHCDAWRRKWCVAEVVEENFLLYYCNLV